MPAWLVAALAVVLAAGAAAADPLYSIRMTPLKASPEGQAGGYLYAASAVEEIERREGWVRVRIAGWRQEAMPGLVHAKAGKRIPVAAVRGIPIEPQGEPSPAKDGEPWRAVALTAWVAAAELAPALDETWARAEGLFASRCTVCHERRIPARYTANELDVFMKTMGANARLSRDEQALVLKYLQKDSKDGG